MLTYLVEVDQRILQSLANGRHSSQGGTLELLALEERLSILKESDIIAIDSLNQSLCCGNLAERYPEVVCIVEGIHEIFVERVNVCQLREAIEDSLELFAKSLGGEFDFSNIEGSYTINLEAATDLCWKATLRAAEDDVEEFLGSGHWSDLFPGRLHLD